MKTLVVGVGNENRGDDGAGLIAARWLRDRAPAGTKVVEADGEPALLLDLLTAADRMLLVDAARGAGHPGRVRRIQPADVGQSSLSASTHDLGVAEALELAAALAYASKRSSTQSKGSPSSRARASRRL